MITKFLEYICESSSLTKLGVPNEVMVHIQKNYEIPSEIEWEKIRYKKDFNNEIKKDENAIYIEIGIDYIKIITNKNKLYTEQLYKYDENGWGGYDMKNIENKTYTQLMKGVSSKNLIYKYKTKSFKTRPRIQRLAQREMNKFDEITEDFKINIIRNFNKILSKIYGRRHDDVMQKIAKNMSNVKSGMNTDDLLDFLKDNKKLAEMAKEYEMAKKDEDVLKLNNLEKQYNSLPIFDEYLIKFEVAYSDKFSYRVTIKDLIDDFGLMQTQTSFLYFLYTGRIKDIKIPK